MYKIVLSTGGFDPIHSGHILYLNKAFELGDYLIVGVNSDDWLFRKKGFSFMPLEERCLILKNIKMVDEVVTWDDVDNTANKLIDYQLSKLNTDQKIIFANGGDRNKVTTPEILEFLNYQIFNTHLKRDDLKNSNLPSSLEIIRTEYSN